VIEDPDTEIATALAKGPDPRVHDEHLRCVDDRFVLTGVVHDHPASSARSGEVVRKVDPDVVAVEVPPLAVSLFRDSDDEEPFGAEIRAAIHAANDEARVIGIDSLGIGFVSVLFRRARGDGVPVSVLCEVGSDLLDVAGHALACRAAAVSPWDVVDPTDRGDFEHEVAPTDPPAVQAEDERRHRSRARSLLGAVRRPRSARLLDSSREENMVNNLAALDGEPTVVALVGFDHLNTVADRLSDEVTDRDDGRG